MSGRLAGVAVSMVLAIGCSTVGTAPVRVVPPAAGPRAPLMLADFDRPGRATNVGTQYGAWEVDPADATQFCRIRLVESPRVGDRGYSVMIDYDVDSPNPAFNGFWMKLPSVPLGGYTAISFAATGDAERGFTRRVKLELKDGTKVAHCVIEGIGASWKRLVVPLRLFDGIKQVQQLTEFVIVFEDQTVTAKAGAIYLDEIVLE